MDRFDSLDSFFYPKSVAVVGASASLTGVGGILMHNLLQTSFGGVVYPINPKRKSVHGVFCYPSLLDTPDPVDLAVIATPAATVPSMIEQCVERGIRSAIIISAGFSELGEKGRCSKSRFAKSLLAKCASSGRIAWGSFILQAA